MVLELLELPAGRRSWAVFGSRLLAFHTLIRSSCWFGMVGVGRKSNGLFSLYRMHCVSAYGSGFLLGLVIPIMPACIVCIYGCR